MPCLEVFNVVLDELTRAVLNFFIEFQLRIIIELVLIINDFVRQLKIYNQKLLFNSFIPTFHGYFRYKNQINYQAYLITKILYELHHHLPQTKFETFV